MSKNKCINRSLKPFKDLKSNVSKALDLNDLSISDESLLDVIDMFATDNNLDQDEVLDHIEELSEYIEDYFGVDTKYKPDSTVKELYDEWYTDNNQYINTPYDETKESLEFEEIAKVVTEGTAKTIRLSNGQKMTIIPNSKPVVYYNISPTSVEKTLKNNGLIHSYNDALFVTRKENKTTQQLKEDIYKELELYGYSRNSVTFKDKFNSILVEINEPQRKVDFVDAEVNKSMRSIRDVVEFLSEKIPAIKDKVHYNVTVEDATKILKKAGKAYNDGINAFVHNGEIYLIQGKATQDIAIEEALHVLTESLIADNYALASKMLAEAKKLFPQLVDDIKNVYKGGKGEQDREILTQALARIFRQEFNEGQRQEAESILKRFVNWVRQLFGLNPVTGNIIIELEQLSKDMTLRDFAQLINSSNAEFRTWSHNKTQFNKTSSSYNTFKDVATEEEYEQLLVELELSRDKTDTFLYNFVTKILNVNPKVKLDKSIPLTVQNFRKPDIARIPLADQEKLPKRIFGVEQSVTLGVNSKSLKNYIELDWESDLIRELEILESTKVRVLDRLYKEKRELEKDIKTIKRILKSREYASSEDLKYVEKFLENKNNKRSTYQHLGYELQKLNKNLEAKNTEIKNFIFKNYSKKLAIKNRLVALKTIPDIKELIYQRLVAEKKAYTLPEDTWNEHIKPWLELYKKAEKASEDSKLLKHVNPVFDSIYHLLGDDITIKDLKKGILKVHPEYEELLNLIEQTNPNVVIKVLTDQVYEAFDNSLFGSAGKFSPKTNTVTLRETSDIGTIIHELIHAASYYGLVGSATRQKEDTLEFKVIDPFIKYINDYLKEHVGDFGPITVWGVKGPASIYGFTNASEFIAELFSNTAFQELLDSIPPMEKKQFNSLLEEIISDIIDFIKEFFGVQTKETALTQAKQLAMAVIRTQQMHSEEIYKQLEDLQDESDLHKVLDNKGSKTENKVIAHKGDWNRIEVAKDRENLYIFTDNTDRDSGSKLIEPTSNYAQKYGKNKHYPQQTQAVIRGLNNAMPLSTQRWYHDGAKGKKGQWTDDAFDEFKKVIDAEIEDIKKEWSTGKYKNLVVGSADGFFNTRISEITKERVPKIYDYLDKKVKELYDYVNQDTKSKKSSKKKSLDDYVAEVEEMIDGFNRTVKKDKDFKKYHKYTITIDGKEEPVDISVTKLNEQVLGLIEFDDNGTVYPQGHIGNSFDALVRDYFDLSPEEFASKKYPNLNNKQVESLKKQLDQFKKQLDETFKDGYKVITKDWSLGGSVTVKGKKKLVAGSIDMMVVTNSGDIYIYDMKTTSKDIKENLKKYRGQLTFYKELITATYPEIGKRIKGIGLLICDINFGNKYGNDNYKAYSLEKENSDQLLFNGEKIQKQLGHINPVIQTTNDAQGGFIRNLDTLNKVEELEKNPLDIVEIKSEEDLVAKELERRVKEEADKAVEKVDTEKLGTLKEIVNTDANLEPVSDVEIAYVSKAIMNILSAYVDLLNTNDSYRIKLLSNEDGTNGYAEKYFVDIPREQILTSDVFHKLLTYIRKNHFKYVNRKKEDVYPKLKWINKNFDAIVNAGFARLVTLERVSLTLTKDVTTENANTALAEAFAKAQREESQRMSYDIDAKEKSYMDSIPARLKTKLNKIYKYEYDEYGNKLGIVSDPFGFGIPEFEDGYYVVNTIMSLVHGCSKLSDMKKELLKHQSEYPFLGDVIEAIFNDRQLKTQFYRTFRKNATLYNKLYRVVERDADGDISRIYYRSQPLSVGVKTDRILDNVNTNMETNTPTVFDKVKNGVVKVNGEQVEKLEERLKPLMDLRRYRMSDVKEIRRILKKLGFDNIDNPSALANTKYTETTRQLVNNINNLLRLLKKKANLDKPFFYGSELGTSFYYIAKSLTVAMDDTYEISVYDGGKSRMTYTEPTELQTILEILGDKNPSMPFERIIEEKYKKYAQFYDGKDFTSSWLTELSENPELREALSHHVRTTFEDTPYLKQNDKEYALSLILDYASPMISGNDYYKGKGDLALFRVPIMSDKNSAESILFKKYAVKYDKPEDGYGINEMKKEITDRAYSFFLQEIKRMKSVYQQLLNDPSGDIEFYHMRDPKAREKFVIKDANGKPKKLKKLTVKDFLELRSEKKFNGFMFSYCPWFNAEMDKSTKLAQYIVDIINGENAPAGFKKLYEKVIKAGLEADYAKWKDHIENELHISPKMLAASITDITSIPSKKTEGQLTSYDAFMQEYFWNDYLATCNIYHLTIIDPAFNKDTVDLQKRFSQVHSSTIKCDTEATFEDENKVERNFSDGTFRFIILEDLTAASTMAKDVEQIFLKAAEKAEKEGKTKEAKELMLLAKTIPSQYDKIDVSDGQAFSSPTGFWKKLNMLGEFDPEFDKYIMQLKDALDNISKGDFSIRNFNFVKQAFKPFLYGHSPHFESNTDMGDYLVPTQLKDSEAMLVLYGAIMQGADKHSPLTALFKFMENSHWVKDENGNRVYNDKGIDTIAFHSAVKVGAYGIVDINDLNSEDEVLEALEGAVVHEIPYSAWGKQVENPEHLQDHTQGMGSQQRVLTVSDIPDDAVLVVNGKKYTKEEFLNKYFNNIAKDMRNGIDNVIKKLKLKGNRLERNKALSELLQKAVVKDAKYTDALRKAFTLNDKGEFDIPLGDPMIADKFFSTLFSLVKKNVNLEEFQGGPVVQMSVFGMVDDLQMKYKYPDSKTGLYCEAYMTAPTKELEDRITVTKKNIKEVKQHFGNKYQIGEMLETDDAIELGYMYEKEAWCIFDRIPTEDKYSIWPCRIKRFLSRQMGEFCILPKEITKFSGTDFDNDKGFITVRFKNEKSKSNKLKNEIFEMQLAALLHSSTLEKSVHPGSFDPLKDLAKDVDPNFGKNSISLMTVGGQYYYRHNNAAGKEYVGIAALNNICHAMSEMAQLGFRTMVDFKVNGISSEEMFDAKTGEYRYDTVTSIFDGTRISRTLGMFVGASADNAKDAVLASIGCTPTTATYVNGLLRMGIPLNVVVYMMTNPAVQKIVQDAEFSGERLENIIEAQVNALIKEKLNDDKSKVYSILSKTDFNAKSLLKAIKSENEEMNEKVLYFLYAMTPYVQAIADSNAYFALNSTKNSVGPDVYTTVERELNIKDLFDKVENEESVLGDSFLKVDEKLPFLKVLRECYDDLIPSICEPYAPIYQKEFRDIIKDLKRKGLYLNDENIKKVYNAYLVFRATKVNVLDGSYEGRMHTIFDTPITVFKDKLQTDNMFMTYLNVKNRMNKGNKIPTVIGKSTNLSTDTRNELSAHWNVLSKDNRTKELSDLVFAHFLQKFGFMFHPNSPLSMASSYVKTEYGNGKYADIFDTKFNKKDFENFIIQYARNNPKTRLWYHYTPGKKLDEDNILRVSDNELMVDITKINLDKQVGINIYSDLYVKDGKPVGTHQKLKKVSVLGIENNFLEYNANENGINMETINTEENKEKYGDALKELLVYTDPNAEATEEEESPYADTPNVSTEDIFESQMMEKLLKIKEYKEFSSKVKAKEESVLNDIYQKLRRDKTNRSKAEFTQLLQALNEKLVC